MKLDRNINLDRRGKYALIRQRKLAKLVLHGPARQEVEAALEILRFRGVLDYGTGDDSGGDFFVIRLKDKYAAAALGAYGVAAYADDQEYGMEILNLAKTAAEMNPRIPD